MALIQTEVIAYVTPMMLRQMAERLESYPYTEFHLRLEDGAVIVVRHKEEVEEWPCP